ncbi:hypothetical protein KY284_014877 [Solanum tuberosum]|nr:hypothetical protein KY284_025779 [Solanum tuberosum]KAH0700662.1 hypothetical protein KY284_014877 [Solanum tuberosum]
MMADLVIGATVKVVLDKLLSLTIEEAKSLSNCKKNLKMLTKYVSMIQALIHDAERRQVDDQAVEKWLEMLERVAEDAENVFDEFRYESLKAQVMNIRAKLIQNIRNFFSHTAFKYKMSGKINNINEELRAINNLANDLGKTTVAKRIFNDEHIKQQFEKRVWLCLPEMLETKSFLELILESLTKRKVEVQSRDVIVKTLQDALGEKKYLLVLDDLWRVDSTLGHEFMDTLRGINTSRGNCILVTTRIKQVASTVAIDLHMLGRLARDHCWSIFKQRIFVDGEVPEEVVSMENRIVEMCQGLPLAASEYDNGENSLKKILKLSYDYLPSPHLKKCFAYFAIFPKDFEFEKDQLIQFWMVEGFLCPCQEAPVMEDVGNKFFQLLLQNSLLQDVKLDEQENTTHCKMHGLVHDLARDILKSKLSDPKSVGGEKLSQVRYFGWDSPREQIDRINEPERLCTLFWRSNYVSEDILLSFKFLRVLNLSSSGIKVLSAKIGKLIYLRYLDLSDPKIKVLPKSICKLYNLQTFRINSCFSLKKLPEEMANMINGLQPHPNLKTLAVVDYLGTKFPSWFSEGLLPNLVVLKLSGCKRCKEIPSLGQMKFLRHLQLIGFLELESIGPTFYGVDVNENGSSSNNLNIQVFPSLKELVLKNMHNLIEWKGDKLGCSNLTSLVKLTVDDVKELTCVPDEMLRNNVSLQHLLVSLCRKFRELPQNLYNLHSLKSLRISFCPNFSSFPVPTGDNYLTSLQSLELCHCDRLTSLPSGMLNHCLSLVSWNVINCNNLVPFFLPARGLYRLGILRIGPFSEMVDFEAFQLIFNGIQQLLSLRTLEFLLSSISMAINESTSTATASNIGGSNLIDSSNPLYMHPSDNPGATLVPVPFDGGGYRLWRRSVLRALSVKNKLGFVNGECKKPEVNSIQFRQWEQCDDMVTSWILNSLSKEISDSVEYVNDSIELWKELEDRYDQTNGAKLYQIQKEINDLTQGTLDITAYYTKMKKLWEELNNLCIKSHCTCVCLCGAKENVHKAEQDRRLVQFLMGLNEVYTAVRGSILMLNPLPSMAQAFSILIQEEKQREFKPRNVMNMDSVSLNASSSGSRNFNHGSTSNTGRSSAGNYVDKSKLFCDFCKRTRHTMHNCYKLHGYPQSTQNEHGKQNPSPQYPRNPNSNPHFNRNNQAHNSNLNYNYKFNSGQQVAGNVHSTPVDSMINEGVNQTNAVANDSVSLSREQYHNVMTMLHHFQVNNAGAFADSPDVGNGSVNFAGNVVCTSSIDFGKFSCKHFESKSDLWILDSGASNHMTFHRSFMTNIRPLPYPILISLPNGYKVKVTELGDITLTPKITLYKVLYVPSFKFNLIYIHSLTVPLKGIVTFSDTACLLQAPSMKRPQEIGKCRDGLYFLCSRCLINSSAGRAANASCLSISNSVMNNHASSSQSCLLHSHVTSSISCNNNEHIVLNSVLYPRNNEDLLWHNRLGHVPFAKMRTKDSIPVNFKTKQPFLCPVCPMSRQTRLPFSKSTTQSTRLFELLHVDLWGPYHTPTHDNHKYFITMVDDYSRSTWTHLLSCKSNALQVIKAFISMVETQFDTSLKTIRSDNGLEFINNEATLYFQSKGIIHQKSCPYTPQQNGVVERKHKYLLETARTLMFQSHLPQKYWGECILTATHIINRLPSNYLHGKCPFEVLYQRKPLYSALKNFGCLCYPTIPKVHRDKFEPRTTPHIFVGYPFGTKGYKVLSLATRKIHVSRDVVFHESVFPFTSAPKGASFDSVSKSLHCIPSSPLSHLPYHFDCEDTSVLLPYSTDHESVSVMDTRSPLDTTLPPDVNDPITHIVDESVLPRKSSRTHKAPAYLNDYHCPTTTPKQHTSSLSLHALFSNHHHITPDAISPDSQFLLQNVCHDSEPMSYEEAAINPAWQAAMTQEFEALHANHTWDLLPLPLGKRAIGCKWVYRVKHKADGSIERFKARLVVKGYTQQAGIDYVETFSPVVKMTTVRSLIATTVKRGWNISQLDVTNAFLHGDLHEEVYMETPPGLMVDTPGLVCKLNKSLYGLKQASRQWYEKLTAALYSRGYTHSVNDYSLFYKKSNKSTVFLAVYVDDVILTGTDSAEIDPLKKFLHDQFKIKDLGRLHYFLGLEVLYKSDGVLISQRKFALDLLKEFDCLHCPCSPSPLDPTVKLQAKEGIVLSDPTFYRKLVGKLNFLTNTRLDISYAVQHLSQFLQDPREPHLHATFHLLRYIKRDPTLRIFMSNSHDCIVRAFCDSDWATCPDSRRSVSGYIVLLGNTPISWKSKKQETVSLSSAEAEYRSLRKVVGELVWLNKLFEELAVPTSTPYAVFCDSQSALHIARNPVFHERTKHIEVGCHFVRNKLHDGLMTLHHVTTSEQLADILTKVLTGIKHLAILGKLDVRSTLPT